MRQFARGQNHIVIDRAWPDEAGEIEEPPNDAGSALLIILSIKRGVAHSWFMTTGYGPIISSNGEILVEFKKSGKICEVFVGTKIYSICEAGFEWQPNLS